LASIKRQKSILFFLFTSDTTIRNFALVVGIPFRSKKRQSVLVETCNSQFTLISLSVAFGLAMMYCLILQYCS
jgi:hypothetical protein